MQQDNNQQLNNADERDTAPGEGLLNVDSQEGVTAQDGQVAEQAGNKKKSKLSRAIDITLWVLIAVLVVALVVRMFVYTTITIDGNSMTASYYNDEELPTYNYDMTYHHNQKVHVLKVGKPKRGDVVVFYAHDVDSKFKAMFATGDDVKSGGKYEKLIKRVVALEGDKLWIEQVEEGRYKLVIQTSNGTLLHEDYYKKDGHTLSEEAFVLTVNSASGLGNLLDTTQDNPLVISKGHFFALGDNRADSKDSRSDLGEISLNQLFGIVWQK